MATEDYNDEEDNDDADDDYSDDSDATPSDATARLFHILAALKPMFHKVVQHLCGHHWVPKGGNSSE